MEECTTLGHYPAMQIPNFVGNCVGIERISRNLCRKGNYVENSASSLNSKLNVRKVVIVPIVLVTFLHLRDFVIRNLPHTLIPIHQLVPLAVMKCDGLGIEVNQAPKNVGNGRRAFSFRHEIIRRRDYDIWRHLEHASPQVVGDNLFEVLPPILVSDNCHIDVETEYGGLVCLETEDIRNPVFVSVLEG